METRYTLDKLTVNSVSVKTQQYTVVEETEYPIGKPHRKAYVNSTEGRDEVQSELPEDQRNAIMAVWGSTPTMTDSEPE